MKTKIKRKDYGDVATEITSDPFSQSVRESITPKNEVDTDQEIFTLSVIATALVLIAIQVVQSQQLRNTELMELLHRTFGDLTTPLMVLPPLFLSGIGIAKILARVCGRSRLQFLFSFFAFGILLLASVTKIPFEQVPGAWTGFGFIPTMVSLFGSLVLLFYQQTSKHSSIRKNKSKKVKVVIPMIVMAVYSLVYIQPPNGLINLGDTSYHVLDELLAPMLGSYPLSDYSPQYSGMLGWVLFPLKYFSLSGESIMLIIVIASNIFNLLIPLLVLLIVIAVFPKLPKMITFASFVVIWGVSGPSRGASIQLREFAHFGRFVPILIVVWVIVRMLNSHGFSRQQLSLIAGLASAFIVLGSPDYGLSFVIAFLLSLSLATYRKWIKLRISLLFTSGILIGITSYLIILTLSGKSLSLESWIGLRSGARSLYGGGEIDIFGPHLFVMAIAVAAIGFGVFRNLSSSSSEQEITFRVIILSIGLWMFALMVKYLLSPNPVALPQYFIPAFIAFLLIFGHLRLNSKATSHLLDRLNILPFFFVAALPLAALWNFPEPRDEFRRISGRHVNTTNWSSSPGRVSDGWSPSALKVYDDFIVSTSILALEIDSDNFSVGYFGIFGHTIELLTGIDNVLGIPAPESLRFGSSQEKLACLPVDFRRPDFVIVYGSSFPCVGYSLDLSRSLEKFLVYKRFGYPAAFP